MKGGSGQIKSLVVNLPTHSKMEYCIFYRCDKRSTSGEIVSSRVCCESFDFNSLAEAHSYFEQFVIDERDFANSYGIQNDYKLLVVVPTSFVYSSLVTDFRDVTDVYEDLCSINGHWLFDILSEDLKVGDST